MLCRCFLLKSLPYRVLCFYLLQTFLKNCLQFVWRSVVWSSLFEFLEPNCIFETTLHDCLNCFFFVKSMNILAFDIKRLGWVEFQRISNIVVKSNAFKLKAPELNKQSSFHYQTLVSLNDLMNSINI